MALISPPTPTLRTFGLLTAEAPRLGVEGDRWREGVTFQPLGPANVEATVAEMCFDDEATYTDDDFTWNAGRDGEGEALETNPTFLPFTVKATESCTTLDLDINELKDRIRTRVELAASAQIARELVSGALSGSPSLSSVALVAQEGAVDKACVIPALEQAAADLLSGGLGYVHLSPAALAALPGDMIRWDGQRWTTPSGHIIIADPGYSLTGASGETFGVETAYISGPVLWHLGPDRFSVANAPEYLDRTRNTSRGRTEHEAIFAFDPATVASQQFEFCG